MENNLNRSIRLLDESVVAANRTILRHNFNKLKRENLDISITLTPAELEVLRGNGTNYEETFHTFLDENKTLSGSVIRANEPWKNITENLYFGFYELLQTNSDSNDALSIISEMSGCCSDVYNVVKGLKSKVNITDVEEDTWLENERNTWRLMFALYGNRLNSAEINEEDYTEYYGRSEKYCMLSLFKKESLVREIQLVIDWLECNATQRDDEVLHFLDNTMGWENTLHQLKSKDTIVFEASRKIVRNMDPDAPHRTKLPIHDLDLEDDRRLSRKIYREIRCGKLREAQMLCSQCGHVWRGALLEGWKLYHNSQLHDDFHAEFQDVQYMPVQHINGQRKPIEGNESRDVWKMFAWQYCYLKNLDIYERAVIAAYCGNLKTILSVCSTWEDYLWAYMRVMIDIRVEADIRQKVMKSYKPMPEEYWDQKMSINEIFAALEANPNFVIQREAQNKDHIIQKYLILDEPEKLVDTISEWVVDPSISSQFLRFLCHLVLLLEQIGQTNNREAVETTLEEYIKRLVAMRNTELVAYYVNKLNESTQIHIYSSYLETILDKNERFEAQKIAENCGLNIYVISKQVVENIRAKHELPLDGDLQAKVTKLDEFKISSLDWLCYNENQLQENLIQTNALIFQFLTLKKLDAAQLAFNKLPVDVVHKINSDDDVKESMHKHVKEYLSYKAYLDAQEAFSLWFKHFKARPIEPELPTENAQFTEKVAYEHRVSQYQSELGRWKLTVGQLSKQAKSTLYNILLFPDGGWLSDAKDAHYLQSACIPECTLLLYTVLYESEQYEECVQLADVLVNETHKLYQNFTSERLGEIFRKLAESSIALLNKKKDPWGHDLSV